MAIERIFIANRGEIAVRVIRTCQKLGIETVLGMSEADRFSLGAQLADRALCLGPAAPAASYLNIPTVVQAALGKVAMQQNVDMRKISAWVAIAAVPTALAGIYGMNFEHMPELHWTWGYPAVLLVMFCVCFALYRTFRHNHWL